MRNPGPIAMTVGGKPVKQFVENFSASRGQRRGGGDGGIQRIYRDRVNKGNAARTLAANRGAEVLLQIA